MTRPLPSLLIPVRGSGTDENYEYFTDDGAGCSLACLSLYSAGVVATVRWPVAATLTGVSGGYMSQHGLAHCLSSKSQATKQSAFQSWQCRTLLGMPVIVLSRRDGNRALARCCTVSSEGETSHSECARPFFSLLIAAGTTAQMRMLWISRMAVQSPLWLACHCAQQA